MQYSAVGAGWVAKKKPGSAIRSIKYPLFIALIAVGSLPIRQEKPLMLTVNKQAAWDAWLAHTEVSFTTSSVRFNKDTPPQIEHRTEWKAVAWKGEKIHTQLLIWGRENIKSIKVTTTALKEAHGHVIGSGSITAGFVQYVITDEFKGGCGYRTSRNFDSSLVADIINTKLPAIQLAANTVQPVWLSIQVPQSTAPGIYSGDVFVEAGKKYTLHISLSVADKSLPPTDQWTYQLDLWQHPAAIARIHHVPLWSAAHFTWMKQYYTMLAGAGQKNITASIVDEPWGHQTHDDYPGLVRWIRNKNGNWRYDYTLFDKYVSFVMSCGIKGRINCYSMVPWKIAFSYYDEASGRDTVFTQAIGTPAYNAFWSVMLKDFTKHLKARKWFSITAIAMDERPMAAMQSVIALLKIDRQGLEDRTGRQFSSRYRAGRGRLLHRLARTVS